VSITAWTIIVVIAVVALVVVIKLAILALVVKGEEIRSIHQHPDGTYDDEEVDDVVKSRRERRE
jgi:hypothetical protein